MVRSVFKKMTAVQIVSAVTVTVCLLVDTMMIGRFLGVYAVGAYGLANPVVIIFNAMGTMVAAGVHVMLGKAMGRGDLKKCGSCFSTSIMMSIVLSAIWMAVIFAAVKPLCVALGTGYPSQDNPLYCMTRDYLRGYILGAPFYFFSQIMVPYLQAVGKRRLTVVSVAVMTAADIVFDLLSVLVFHSGMFGIGLASGLSYLAAALVGVAALARSDSMFRFDRKGVDLRFAYGIARAGSPILINQAFFMIRVYVINHILLAVSGTVAVAVLSVASTVGNIFFSIGIGAGAITLMLSSIFYSEEDRSSLYEVIRVMVSHSLKLIVTAVAIAELTAPWLMRFFIGNDPEALAIGVPGMRIYISTLICCVLTTVFKNYYQGTGHMTFTNVISFFDNVGLIIPIVWIFSRLMGLDGVWLGILVAQIGTLLFISAVVWVRYGRISFTAEAYSMLDSDFGADPADVLEMSVNDMDSAIAASKATNDFCSSKGLGHRLSMLVSLCVEEIVVNIIDHGFTKDEDTHSAEMRLVVDSEKCIIRVRDNCIGFDPIKYLELHQDNDPTEDIGIRMVMAMVSDINYINSLGLNNLYMVMNR